MNTPRYIVVHHTASHDTEEMNAQQIRGWHEERGWLDIGYHIVIERVGDRFEAIMGRPFDMDGAHAPGFNKRSIGVAFVGNFMRAAPTDEMLRFAARHISALCRAYDIPAQNIIPHSQIKATFCPGDEFPLERFRAMVFNREEV